MSKFFSTPDAESTSIFVLQKHALKPWKLSSRLDAMLIFAFLFFYLASQFCPPKVFKISQKFVRISPKMRSWIWSIFASIFRTHFGLILPPKWDPKKEPPPTFSPLKIVFNPTLALFLRKTALECYWACFLCIFLHHLDFFFHPFLRSKLPHGLGSWTFHLYFEGAAVHRRRRLR